MLIKCVPTSDATNVFDLLQDVKQAILEEPRRLNMNHVAVKVESGSRLSATVKGKRVLLPNPTCGTVGCFAGWTMMLAGLTPMQASMSWIEGAQGLLGHLNYNFTSVDGKLHSVFNWGAGDGILGMKPGTRAYARAVIKRINRFIETNGGRAVLKARPIHNRTVVA